MKHQHAVIAILLCAFSLTPWTPVNARQHHHHAEASAAVPAQRWMPDASLSEGMRRVHMAVDALRHHEMGHMSAPMVVDHATEVEQAVTSMFTHCKLAPEPDAALHGLLLPLLGAAQALKADPQKVSAVADMRAAIAHYPHYFDDPGWDKPAAVEHVMHDEP